MRKKNKFKALYSRILVVGTSLLLSSGVLFSCNYQPSSDKLPAEATSFLTNHFNGKSVSTITETKNMMDYVVTLEDGTEIEFGTDGEWTQIDFRRNEVPISFANTLPQEMWNYVKEYHADDAIHQIEKKFGGRREYIYCIDFYKPSDVELRFSQQGELISDDPVGKRLPSSANAFLKAHFPQNSIQSLVYDVDGDYNVKMDNTTEVKFSRKGVWFEIRTYKKNEMPETVLKLLPKNLNKYVTNNYPGQFIRRIEKKSYGYRVKLNKPNNVEVLFTKNGEFMSEEAKTNDSGDGVEGE